MTHYLQAKFGKPGFSCEAKRAAPALAYMYAMYWVALREANKDPEKEVLINHNPPNVARSTPSAAPYRRLPGITEDDMSF